MLLRLQILLTIVLVPCLLSAQENEWVALNEGINNRNVFCITADPDDPDVLYAGTEDGCYRSENRGERWQRIYQGLPTRSVWVSPGGEVVLATLGGGSRSDGVWISRNGGNFQVLTWIMYPCAIAVDPENNDHIFVGSMERGVIFSLNGGGDWQEANNGLPSQIISHLGVKTVEDETWLFACTDEGLARAQVGDDIEWEVTINGFPMGQTAFSFEDENGVFAGTNDETDSDALYYSDDLGEDWEITRWAHYVRAAETAPELVVMASVEIGVARSSNGGEDWTEMNQELGSRNFTDLLIQVEGNATIVYHTSNNGVFAYTIPGDENHPPVWENIPEAVHTDENELLEFTVVGSDPEDDELTITYSSDNLPDAVEFTDNEDGTADFSWQTTFDDAGEYTATFVLSDDRHEVARDVLIVVNNVNRAPVLAAIGNREINEGEELAITLEATDPDDDDFLFSVENLPEGAELNGADFNWTPDYNQAGIYENVIFTVTDDGEGELTDEEIVTFTVLDASHIPGQRDESIPTELSLHPAYPNPFNSTTTIAYGLPFASRVSLQVIDLSGRTMKTLVDTDIQPGFHSVTLSANELPAGLYLIKLEASGETISQKVMLIK